MPQSGKVHIIGLRAQFLFWGEERGELKFSIEEIIATEKSVFLSSFLKLPFYQGASYHDEDFEGKQIK